MVQVRLSGTFKSYAGGRDAFEIGAANVRHLLGSLGEAHPKLRPILHKGGAIAIDGEIYRASCSSPSGSIAPAQ